MRIYDQIVAYSWECALQADGCFAEAAEDCLDDDQIRLLGALLAPQTSFESRVRQSILEMLGKEHVLNHVLAD